MEAGLVVGGEDCCDDVGFLGGGYRDRHCFLWALMFPAGRWRRDGRFCGEQATAHNSGGLWPVGSVWNG
jgi:hypothetical protein